MQIQAREKIGWPERQSMDKEKQGVLLEKSGLLLRRPVRGRTEEQKGNLKQIAVLPGREYMGSGRDLCKVNGGE